MDVSIFTAYFAPEKFSDRYLLEDVIEALAQNNHSVNVYTPTPTRDVEPGLKERYKRIKRESLYGGKVRITRLSLPEEGRNIVLRAFRYITMNILFLGVSCHRKTDVIYVQSTPPTQGAMAGLMHKITRTPFVYHLQDLFPESLVTTGISSENSLAWKIGAALERFAYKNAESIIVISESFKSNLLRKKVKGQKINIIPNWVDTSHISPIAREDNRIFDEYNIDRNKFIVVYAGNFGESQGAEIVIEAAKLLENNKDIYFVVFGGGVAFKDAKETAKTEKLSNIVLNDMLPMARVAEVYSLGDCSLITCKKNVGKSGIPSKTWNAMACETPIIASFDTDSDLAEIINQAAADICVTPEDPRKLADAILEFSKSDLNKYRNGRSFVKKNIEKELCVDKVVSILEKAARK